MRAQLVLRHPHIVLAACVAVAAAATMLVVASEADGGVDRVSGVDRAIALTFDDGPDPRHTPAVLDALAAADARATFFLVGDCAAEHPELVERILAEGHEVAHHTQTHPRLDRLSATAFGDELDTGLATLDAAGSPRPTWYRPPRGFRDAELEEMARTRGLRVVLWSTCFESKRHSSAAEMAKRVARETHDGDIVLAHDGLGNRSMTVEALPLYLAEMRERDVEVLTLSQLWARSGASR